MNNSIALYEEALLTYFKDLEVEDGEGCRNPQVVLAVTSRSSSDLIMSDDFTPILPIITLTRTGVSKIDATHIVKTHITRKFRMRATQNMKAFMNADFMPVELGYKVDIWTLFTAHHLALIEQLMWKMEKTPWINVQQSAQGVEHVTPGYIRDWNVGEQTTYDSVGEESYRILKSSFDFKLFAQLLNDNYASRSVLIGKKKVVIVDREIHPLENNE